MSENSEPDLALIVGGARSGTTLLRQLLEAHSEVGCPPEAGLPSLMAHMAQVWATVGADVSSEQIGTDPGYLPRQGVELGPKTPPQDESKASQASSPQQSQPELSEAARKWIRQSVREVMIRYCGESLKHVYVDKSLDSVYHLAIVEQVFPQARFVLAFRHVMDTIASGLEASPWGFQAYGYAPYTHASPGNFVAALASYWLDHVTAALEWEARSGDRCMRVRYEDLVDDPERWVAQLQQFLGVEEDLSVLQRAFEDAMKPGPADYKIEYTTTVHDKSVGRGKRVPVEMIAPPLLRLINEKLEVLGYSTLDRTWNTAERSVGAVAETIWSRRLQECMAHIQPGGRGRESYAFALVAEDHTALRWVIDLEDGSVVQGDGDVDAVLTGTAEDLVLMLTEEENLGVLLRSGRVRYVIGQEDVVSTADTRGELDLMISVLRSGRRNPEE